MCCCTCAWVVYGKMRHLCSRSDAPRVLMLAASINMAEFEGACSGIITHSPVLEIIV